MYKKYAAGLIVSLGLSTLIGCDPNPNAYWNTSRGREVPPPAVPGPVGPAGPTGPQGSSQVYPFGIQLDVVNKVDSYLTKEGLVLNSYDTSDQQNLPGAFDDADLMKCSVTRRLGNKAWIGISALDQNLSVGGTLVSSLRSIAVTARRDDGTDLSTYLNLLIDCDGNGVWDPSIDAVVVASSEPAQAFSFPQYAFSTVTVRSSDAVFRSVGAKCGFNLHLTGVPISLDTWVATHPNARLIAAVPQDCGMPKGRTMAPIMFIQGDSGTTAVRRHTVKSIVVTLSGGVYSYPFTN